MALMKKKYNPSSSAAVAISVGWFDWPKASEMAE